MKKCIQVFSIIIFCNSTALYSQYSTFIFDDFTDTAARIDLSDKIIRKDYDGPVSAFEIVEKSDVNGLTYHSIHLSPEGIEKGGYSFDNGDYMTHTCIDYVFPREFDTRDNDTIKIEFDAIFNQVSGSGESNRLVVHLIHEYPGEPGLGDYKVIEGHPFGRPAYNIRILPGSYGMFMAYGGGEPEEGTFEVINNNTNWLPGFSSAAGGGTIGQGDPYPASSWNEIEDGTTTVSTTVWKHYTIKLTPSRLSVFMRDSEADPVTDQPLLFMEMPEDGDLGQINAAHGTFAASLPPNYYWFETLNALRFFWRAAGDGDDFYIANVVASKSGEPITTFVEFGLSGAAVAEDDGIYEISVDIFNPGTTKATNVDVVLVSGDSALIDNYSAQTLTFEAGSEASQELLLTINADDDDVNDTLVFELQGISGGDLPSIGATNTFKLIVEEPVASIIANRFANNLKIYPLPAEHTLYVESEAQQPVHLEVYSITGMKLMEIENYLFSPLPLNNVAEGIYILKLDFAERTFLRKFNVRK